MVQSSQPRKQRKATANAPMHVQRKRVRARNVDPRYPGVRTVTVRAGDRVRVIRGDHGQRAHGKRYAQKPHKRAEVTARGRGKDGLEGPVVKVQSADGTIFVGGVKVSKADKKEVAYPVHASNVVVIEIDDSDALRKQQLQERGV